VTKNKQPRVKRIKLDFSPEESVTSFGGMAVVKRLLLRLGVDGLLESHLPARRGYSLSTITMSAVAGLLSGAQGTVATEVARHDPALRKVLGVAGAPEEATFWRSLWDAGSPEGLGGFAAVCSKLARRAIERTSRVALCDRGFVPVFVDGTLLEGSLRREGTKSIRDKGDGLLWTVGFVGPYPVAQRLAASGEGEGEATHARELLGRISREVLRPAGIAGDALVLMDSLHGNGPTLDVVEALGLAYVIGSGSLTHAEEVLADQPESQWTPSPEYDASRPGIEESSICVASMQCGEWSRARVVVGRRWRKAGEFVWNYASVLTNLDPCDPRLGGCATMGEFARRVWKLYDRKGGCENGFKNLLTDLGLHHPPCQQWRRNAGFYAIGMLAGLIAMACDVLASKPSHSRRRIATLRRWLLAVPGRVTRHARTVLVTVLGLSEWWRLRSAESFARVARC
jgi:hypothetical protein